MKTIIGRNLKMFREASNFTAQKFADLLSIERSTYANYEAGLREMPFDLLEKTADFLGLDTPISISIIYLGFGAGLAVFLFSGFIKNIPYEIEEAATIDGCNTIQVFFLVVAPIMKSTYISVGILEVMWVWNDYLLPYLVLDKKEYRTIPIQIQYLQGSYGQVDYGATMALIVLCLLPIIIIYFICQRHIISGVLSGAVKG